MFLIIMGILLLFVAYGLVRTMRSDTNDSVVDNNYNDVDDREYNSRIEPTVDVEKTLILDQSKTDHSLDNFIPPRFYVPPKSDDTPSVDLLQPITATVNNPSNTKPKTKNTKSRKRVNNSSDIDNTVVSATTVATTAASDSTINKSDYSSGSHSSDHGTSSHSTDSHHL